MILTGPLLNANCSGGRTAFVVWAMLIGDCAAPVVQAA
jgi:hypothetical protein